MHHYITAGAGASVSAGSDVLIPPEVGSFMVLGGIVIAVLGVAVTLASPLGDGGKVVAMSGVALAMVGAIPFMLNAVVGRIGEAAEPTPASTPAAPAEPTNWNPLIIVVSVTLAITFIGALVYFGGKAAKRHKAKKIAASETRAAVAKSWQDVFDRHDAVKDDLFTYTADDIGLRIKYPALQGTDYPFMRRLVIASEKANTLRPARAMTDKYPTQTPYFTAVCDLEGAWTNALKQAKKIAQSDLTPGQRKNLKLAKTHWAVVCDENATAAERALHAEQMKKCLDGIIELAPRERRMLETVEQRALETGVNP